MIELPELERMHEIHEQEKRWSRAEWISTAALAVSVATMIFGGGAFWQAVQDQERRLVALENTDSRLVPMVERIDERVAFMADLASEERMRR